MSYKKFEKEKLKFQKIDLFPTNLVTEIRNEETLNYFDKR